MAAAAAIADYKPQISTVAREQESYQNVAKTRIKSLNLAGIMCKGRVGVPVRDNSSLR